MDDAVRAKQDRMRQTLDLQRPDRLPCSDIAWAEYRPDVYHLGEPELIPDAGEVAVSANGKKRFTRDGGVWNVGDPDRFRHHEDVLAVDIDGIEVETVGPAMLAEMSRLFAGAAQRGFPGPLHYGTLVTRATLEFGWEPFLMASALDPEQFGKILDRFAAASLAVIEGWCLIDGPELITIHDDIAATRGVLMRPEWYREYVFPWYERFFATVHDAGRKSLYMCDGNYLPVLDDILAAGADGLYIESSSMDPGEFMERAGADKLFMIKSENRNIDVGTPEDIRQELMRLADLHQRFPGMMMYRGGGNPPPENADAFNRYYQEYLVYE